MLLVVAQPILDMIYFKYYMNISSLFKYIVFFRIVELY